MIKHTIANAPLPPFRGALFEYILAADGVYLRAEREGLWVLLNIAPAMLPIRGLLSLGETVMLAERVPANVIAEVIARSTAAMPCEALFYLNLDAFGWQVHQPEQYQTAGRVRPANPNAPVIQRALVEIHSHHRMTAYFSEEDDADEAVGFRIYAVVGELDTAPAIRVRVGVHGHLLEIPAALVFDLPEGVRDVNDPGKEGECSLSTLIS